MDKRIADKQTNVKVECIFIFSIMSVFHRPALVDIGSLTEKSPKDRLSTAFRIAHEEFGVEPLLLPEGTGALYANMSAICNYTATS